MDEELLITILDEDAEDLCAELEQDALDEEAGLEAGDSAGDIKAANYGARVGQVIAGRLTRGTGGRFSSAGAAAPSPAQVSQGRGQARQEMQQARGEARQAKKPKVTPEQRAADKATQQEQNRAAVFSALKLPEDAADSLMRLSAGEAVSDDGGLEALGLAQRDKEGQLRLTPQGRAVMAAAQRGDAGRARDALSLGKDRAAAAAERRQKQEEKEKQGGGGGGGGSAKPSKDQQLAENYTKVATALVSAGFTLDDSRALMSFMAGSAPTERLGVFAAAGLVEQDSAGGFRLTKEGRALNKAAKKGDVRAAMDAVSAAHDRMQAEQEPAPAPERDMKPSAKGAEIETDPESAFYAPMRAIKAGGKRHLEIKVAYGGPFKGRDAHGEYFSPATDFDLEHFPTPPAAYYHGFDEHGKPAKKPIYIGKTIKRESRGDGHYITVELRNNREADRTWDASLKGQAVASPATVPHMRRRGADGHLDYWPIVEISAWDGAPNRRPANPDSIAIPVLKSLYAEAGIDLPAGIDAPEATPEAQAMGGAVAAGDINTIKNTQEHTMTPEEIQAAILAAIKADREAQAGIAAAAQAEQAKIEAAVKAERLKWEEEAAKSRRLADFGGQAPAQARFGDVRKYDHLSGDDTAFLIGIVNSKVGQRASESAYKALYIKMAEGKDAIAEEIQSSMKAVGIDPADFTNAAKANELNYPTQAGFGDEWAGVSYSSNIWEVVRAPATIVSMIPEIIIPQGSESVIDPLEGADPTWYKVGPTTDLNATTGRPDATVPSSKIGSDNKTHTSTKVGARVVWNGEMEEDVIIPYVKDLRRKLEVSSQENMEHLVIDGDVDAVASTNINNIAGTPGATAVYLSFDGFRKLALITNTANSKDAGGLLYDTLFLEIAKLMGTAGLLGADKQKNLFLIDPNVMWKILTLTSVKTRDVFNDATIENGDLTGLWGYKVKTTFHMHKQSAKRMANTAGKIHGTDSNNTTGSILSVRPDQWKLARKRKTTIETSRYPEADANQIVVTLRAGLKYRDSEAAAIAYNVGVS